LTVWGKGASGDTDKRRTYTNQKPVSRQAQADNSFHACVDDVGYVLVASYTPVRADGVAGEPVEAESQVVQVRQALSKRERERERESRYVRVT